MDSINWLVGIPVIGGILLAVFKVFVPWWAKKKQQRQPAMTEEEGEAIKEDINAKADEAIAANKAEADAEVEAIGKLWGDDNE